MRKPQTGMEYISNNSFMTSQVKVPNPFGDNYEDPLEALKAKQNEEKNLENKNRSAIPTIPTAPSPTSSEKVNENVGSQVTTIPTTPSATVPTTPSQKLGPTSPVRDFQKVSNSITREAIPSGIFGSGKAKQLYDALYSLTRGAIKPIRVIRITKPRLMKLAGIGTRQTLWLNLEHLESVGLVRKNVLLGEHGGNEYEIFVPEELPELRTIPTTPTTPTKKVYSEQKLVGVVGIESNPTTPTFHSINTDTSDTSNTSFKDNTRNDDDARMRETFELMTKKLDAAVKKIIGKNSSKHEAEKWGTLADLLILELEVAARRVESVSSVPAFLTEVLRRQFFASRQQHPAISKLSKVKLDTVGKSDSISSNEIKPLDKKGREVALELLREFAEDDFVQDFQKWYTKEDWEWLMKQLKNN